MGRFVNMENEMAKLSFSSSVLMQRGHQEKCEME